MFQDEDWFDIGHDLKRELDWLDAGVWLPLTAPGSEGDPHLEGSAGKIFLRLRACGPEIAPPKPGDHAAALQLALLDQSAAALPNGWCEGELDDGSAFYYPDGEPSQVSCSSLIYHSLACISLCSILIYQSLACITLKMMMTSQATKQRPTGPMVLCGAAYEIQTNAAWNIFHPNMVAVELKQIREDHSEQDRKHRVGEQLERVWGEVDRSVFNGRILISY